MFSSGRPLWMAPKVDEVIIALLYKEAKIKAGDL